MIPARIFATIVFTIQVEDHMKAIAIGRITHTTAHLHRYLHPNFQEWVQWQLLSVVVVMVILKFQDVV